MEATKNGDVATSTSSSMFEAPTSFFDSMNFSISIPMDISLSVSWSIFMCSTISIFSTSLLLHRAELKD